MTHPNRRMHAHSINNLRKCLRFLKNNLRLYRTVLQFNLVFHGPIRDHGPRICLLLRCYNIWKRIYSLKNIVELIQIKKLKIYFLRFFLYSGSPCGGGMPPETPPTFTILCVLRVRLCLDNLKMSAIEKMSWSFLI